MANKDITPAESTLSELQALAKGLVAAVHQAEGDPHTAEEAIEAAIKREVSIAKRDLRNLLILAVNDTPKDQLDHSTLRLIIANAN